MIKQADIADTLASVKATATNAAGSAGDGIINWYQSQPQSVRDALRKGLIGAGIGGALTGGSALLNRGEAGFSSAAMPALLGALFGGTAGAGLSLGKGILSGDVKLPGLESTDKRPLTTKFVEPGVRMLMNNYGPVLGGLAPLAHKGPSSALAQLIENPRLLGRLGKVQLAAFPAAAGFGYLAQKAIAGEY